MKDVFVKVKKFNSNDFNFDDKLEIIDEGTILDVILALDQNFYNNYNTDLVDLDQYSTLFHHVWNTQERRFYEDVIIQGRNDEGKVIQIKEDVELIIPEKSKISITLKPDTEKRMKKTQFMFYLNKSSKKNKTDERIIHFYEELEDMHKLEVYD